MYNDDDSKAKKRCVMKKITVIVLAISMLMFSIFSFNPALASTETKESYPGEILDDRI